eukprot:CAMPEP_0174922434 /NCGR_PEP_ID=MMETSP1355-20121228/5876_1 /TAXON_ID=464990 /ORGANISM="Hemiselmis tepida, Strain CCMP443" /LENGTH=93 /DNA_ID=CAMNT_0016168019 /DNA_START=51 /DNA_END=329 /DNA_ORIENTATION=-
MSGEPMEVAIALSLLLAESAAEGDPLRGKVFTFDSQPKLVEVPGVPAGGEPGAQGSLGERVKFARGMEWGGSTNIDAVFDRLCGLAVANGMSG